MPLFCYSCGEQDLLCYRCGRCEDCCECDAGFAATLDELQEETTDDVGDEV